MTPTAPSRDELRLTGRGGLLLVLFAPRFSSGAVHADLLFAGTAIPKGRLLRGPDGKRYKSPAIPGPKFHIAAVTLPEMP